MSIFTGNDTDSIERFAAGLSPEEVLDIWCVTADELSQADLDTFNRCYRRGRALAKSRAVDALFGCMSGRDGVKGSLAYLVRMNDEWPEVTEETESGKGVFKIVLPTP